MRLYRLLLHLYPFSFRADYEQELEDVFGEQSRKSNRFRAAMAALLDVIPNAMAAHWELLRFDLRYALRSLSRTPGFTLTAILIAALGIGANTAAFSIADYVLVRPLAFREPSRLLNMYQSVPNGYGEFSPANYRDLKEQVRSFESVAAYTEGESNLVGSGEPQRLKTISATPDLFPLLGIVPLTGQWFSASQVDSNPVLVSESLWRTQFAADRGILGKAVRLDGSPFTIVGVMPASFTFPRRGIEVWKPLVFEKEDMEDRGNTYLHLIGRIRKGVGVDEARKELDVIGARLEKLDAANREMGIYSPRLREELTQQSRMLLFGLCGAALCILLLSCANLASLFLARGTNRAREIAVRSALGAGRERLVRQLITESLVIAAAGGLAAIALAKVAIPLLAKLVPSTLPIAELPSLDLRVMAMALAFVLVTGLAFGILPALRTSRGDEATTLRGGARTVGGTQRLRGALVVAEICSSVVLLVSAGLLVRAVWNVTAIEPGFRTANVLKVRTALPWPKYETVAARARFFDNVLADVRALPGVKSAAYVTGLPMQMRGMIWSVTLAGEEPKRDGSADVSLRFVTPQFFTTLSIPLRGRDIAESDGSDQPFVAVVSESFAQRHWPGSDAIGRTFKVADAERTVVGVVGDVKVRGLERQSEPQVYLPYRQVKDGNLIGYVPKELVVRTAKPVDGLATAVARIVHRVDPEQPLSDIRPLSELVSDETAGRVAQLRVLGMMALLALVIAGVGIHGLLTYTVSTRAREIGVRRVLGADVREIVSGVMREGFVLALAGIAVGLPIAFAAARAMRSLLAGIRPGDPVTFFGACAVCLITVLAGCVRPAMRAAQLDPAVVLRAE